MWLHACLLSHIVRVTGGSKWVVGYHGDRFQLAPNVDRPWLIEIRVATLVRSGAFSVDWSIWQHSWPHPMLLVDCHICHNLSQPVSLLLHAIWRYSWGLPMLLVDCHIVTCDKATISIYMDCICFMHWQFFYSIEFWVVTCDNVTINQRSARKV